MHATFIGANIKGTPSMSSASVRHDLRVLKRRADIFGVQEFRWTWYWRSAVDVLSVLWRSFPRRTRGIKDSVFSAQALFWKASRFKRIRSYSRPAFDFKTYHADIMNDRWIRAILLQGRDDGFTAWFLTTHFVVGGDSADDDRRRKELMLQHITAFMRALTDLKATGYPIMGEIDANILPKTWAYDAFMKVLRDAGARVYGDHGREYAFMIQGGKGKFLKVEHSVIPDSALRTDHEARVLTWTGVPV